MKLTISKNIPKPRKIAISYDEYLAIQVGLQEIECTIGSGDLPDLEKDKYKKHETSLLNLLNKIIK